MASVISVLAQIGADSSQYVSAIKQAQASTQGFEKAVGNASNGASQSLGNVSKKGGGLFKSLGKLFPGAMFAGGIAGAALFTKSLYDAAVAEEKANRLVENIVTSMGQFDGRTAEVTSRLTDLAQAQALATGQDEDAIKAAQSKLLTFSEVAKDADKMGGTFDRATQASIDLASAGFGSLETNAVQLGKALQDPVKGMGALSRSGVTFSASEKAMIKSLVESGHQLEAQQILLAAVEQQVGGSAASQVSQTARMGQAWGHLKEVLGASIMPMFDKMFKFVNDVVFPALTSGAEKLPGIFSTFTPVLNTIGDIFKKVWAGIGPTISSLLPPLLALFKAFSPLQNVLSIITPLLDPLIALFNQLGTILITVMEQALPIIQNVMGIFMGLLQQLMTDLLPRLMPIIKMLGDAIVLALQTAAPFINQLATTFGVLVGAVMQLLPPLFNLINAILPPLLALFQALIGPIMGIVNLIASELVGVIQLLIAIAIPLINQVASVFGVLMEAVIAVITPLMEIIDAVLPVIIQLFNAIIPPILAIVSVLMDILVPVFFALANFITPIIKGIADVIGWVFGVIADGVKWIMGFIQPIFDAVIDGINAVLSFMGMDTIPKVSTKAISTANKNGEALGTAKANGENKGYLKNRKAAPISGGGTGGGGGGTKKKSPIVEYYKKINDEVAKQNKKSKLLSMGLAESVADSIIGSGEGWEKIYAQVVKGGQKAVDKLEATFANSAENMKKLQGTVADVMKNVRDSMLDGFDLSKMGSTSKAIMGSARKMVDKAKAFGAELTKLAKAGLNPQLLQQVISAGPDEGLKIARALSSASSTDISDLNSMYNQIGDIGNAVGGEIVNAAPQYYITVSGGVGSGATIGKAVVEAIKSYERTSGTNWRTA